MGIYCLYTYNAYFYFNSDKRSQILAYHPNILETLRRSILELTNYICKYANKCNLSMGHRTKRFFQWSGKMGERF